MLHYPTTEVGQIDKIEFLSCCGPEFFAGKFVGQKPEAGMWGKVGVHIYGVILEVFDPK